MEDNEAKFVKSMERIIAREFPKLLRQEVMRAKAQKKIKKGFDRLVSQVIKEQKDEAYLKENPPSHPWRTCPAGSCWVKTHPRKVSLSEKNPNGITIVDGHCRVNRGKKELIHLDEIHRISERHFGDLKIRPCPSDLGFKRKQALGSKYDDLIAGWTKYWNEVLSPSVPLSPNLVKALVASESGFNSNAKAKVPFSKGNYARGLMQITDDTLEILNDEKGELKNHFVKLSKSEIVDPSANIYAGIRWLFHKKKLASSKLGREASWDEAVWNYKAVLKEKIRAPESQPNALEGYNKYMKLVQECKN